MDFYDVATSLYASITSLWADVYGYEATFIDLDYTLKVMRNWAPDYEPLLWSEAMASAARQVLNS